MSAETTGREAPQVDTPGDAQQQRALPCDAGCEAAASAPGGAEWAESLPGRRFFCSWSGGKDAYLALTRAVAAGGRLAALVTMLHENGLVSRGHGLPRELLEAQAAALGVPLVARPTTWDEYEAHYVSTLCQLRAQGIEAGVFGDIDLQAHRDWVENVCEHAGLTCTCLCGRSRGAGSSTSSLPEAFGRPWSPSTPRDSTPPSSAVS